MENIENKLKIGDLLLSVIRNFVEHDTKARYFGTDTKLNHSEIHMIQFIKEQKERLHISAIARKLGITKGAVSQTIKRLEKKGFVLKEVDTENKSRLLIRLTPKGEKAHYYHKKYHRQLDSIILDVLKNTDDENIMFLNNFLWQLDREISKM